MMMRKQRREPKHQLPYKFIKRKSTYQKGNGIGRTGTGIIQMPRTTKSHRQRSTGLIPSEASRLLAIMCHLLDTLI